MSLIMMKQMLEDIHTNDQFSDVSKCIQIKEWRKDFVKDLNLAIALAEENSNKNAILNPSGIVSLRVPNEEEIEIKAFFKEGLDLIDGYLKQYLISKEK